LIIVWLKYTRYCKEITLKWGNQRFYPCVSRHRDRKMVLTPEKLLYYFNGIAV
ncbi:unnamed protein product, partial [Plutella xylostella]